MHCRKWLGVSGSHIPGKLLYQSILTVTAAQSLAFICIATKIAELLTATLPVSSQHIYSYTRLNGLICYLDLSPGHCFGHSCFVLGLVAGSRRLLKFNFTLLPTITSPLTAEPLSLNDSLLVCSMSLHHDLAALRDDHLACFTDMHDILSYDTFSYGSRQLFKPAWGFVHGPNLLSTSPGTQHYWPEYALQALGLGFGIMTKAPCYRTQISNTEVIQMLQFFKHHWDRLQSSVRRCM